MRKWLFFFVLLQCYCGNAQKQLTQPLNERNNLRVFIGAGSFFINHYVMNEYLRKHDIIAMETREFNFMTGLAYVDKNLDVDLCYELFINGHSNDNTKNRTIANGVKLRTIYKVVRLKTVDFGAGFNISYNRRKLSLFWTDYEVDLNNLEEEINGNQLTFFLEKAYLGPSVAVIFKDLGRRKSGQTKITLAYETGLNNKKWQPQFFELQNEIKESRLSGLLLNVAFYL